MGPIATALLEAEKRLGEWIADPDTVRNLEEFARMCAECLASGGRLISCGNGGSLCDAMHFAEEFTGRFRQSRKPYAAIALADPTHITCVGNDYGFDEIFSRGVEAYGREGDVLLLLSTSGNSTNLIRAAQKAKELGVHVVGFLGKGGGELAPLCDLSVIVPGNTSDRIQELHMLGLHAVIESVEHRLGHA